MTVLDRLVHKGGVSREKIGRSFAYTPLLTREGLRRVAVRELLDCFFDGSESALVDYLRRVPETPVEVPRASPAAMEDHRIDTVLL
ncbi:MAG: BlaI/MecI/CopY family transcriptional regulator [Acidobacteria bacterium]|nr:BlaI/MecI/CopY family transcriptional regulator [Acidobacteriota bacterium]